MCRPLTSRATTSAGPFQPVATNVPGVAWVDSGLTNGTTYYYVVSAANGFGAGPTSNVASVTPDGTLPLPVNAAAFVSQSVPATMTPGQAYPVTVTMRNTGTSAWTGAGGYRLGSQSPQDNTTWGLSRVGLPGTPPAPVQPGATAAFTFTVTAPASPGTYPFQWRMVQDGAAGGPQWFGDLTPLLSVAVTVASTLTAPADLSAYATGSGRVTLYWAQVSGASGYNVYRGTAAGGEDYAHPVNGTTPVNAPSYPGSPMEMFTDTALADGTEYFYTVKAVGGGASSPASNEDSDVPDPDAVPWDTRNTGAILSAFQSAFANETSGTGVGGFTLRVVGPDETIYDASSGTPLPTDATLIPGTNQFLRPDGTSFCLSDDLGQFDAPASGMSAHSIGSGLPAGKGPYRRVRTGPKALYRGEAGYVVLPSPFIPSTAAAHGDTALIFMGASASGLEVDTGLQYSTTYGDWEPFMNINGKYVGAGPIHSTHLINDPVNLMQIPSGDMPYVIYWAWGDYPTTGRAKLSLLLVDDTDGNAANGVGALGGPSKYLGKTENVRAKRVNAIAQNALGVYPTGSSMYGASWSQGTVILPDDGGSLQGWSSSDGTPTDEDGSYTGGRASVDAVETSPYIAEDNISINIASP